MPRAAKSMPVPRRDRHRREHVREGVVALGPRAVDGLLLGDACRQLLGDDAVEDDVGGVAEDLRAEHGEHHADHAEQHDGDQREPLRAHPPQQPAGGRPEVQRLLGRHADAAAERTAAAGTRPPAGGPNLGRSGAFAPACAGVLMPTPPRPAGIPRSRRTSGWSRAVPRAARRPTTKPSSSTMIWSASAMVDTRWATMITVRSRVIGRSAARSLASVARSSAENESSNR